MCSKITECDKVRYSDLILDGEFELKYQLKSIKKNINLGIIILYLLKHFFNFDTLKTIYYYLFQIRFDCSLVCWGREAPIYIIKNH